MNTLEPTKLLSVTKKDELNKQYNEVFKDKPIVNLCDAYECKKLQYKIINLLFGTKLYHTHRKRVKNTKDKTQIYTFDKHVLDYHKKLYEYRKPHQDIQYESKVSEELKDSM